MHDRLDHHRMNDDASLAAALRSLPTAVPSLDVLPALLSRIRRRQRLRRALHTGLPAALAAGVAIAVIAPRFAAHHAPAASGATATGTTSRSAPARVDLAKLQESSHQWQAWVAKLDREGAPLDSHALDEATGLQDRIALVDLQLSAARDPATSAELWQQRITLLQQLGLLHLQPYALARQPGDAPTTYAL